MGNLDLIVRSKDRGSGGSYIRTTAEEIVRVHRINSMGRRLESLQPERKYSAILERILKIFFWLVLGWGAGYFHHYFAG